MPASSINLYQMQDARNNFDAMRPAPVSADANQFMGQCQNVHISTNCYYGYHDPKSMETAVSDVAGDCEMMELPHSNNGEASASPQSNGRKRSADDSEYPHTKRQREDIQRVKNNEPETNEKEKSVETGAENLLETLYWNIHGGNIFHLSKCL